MRQTFPVHSPPLNLCLWFYSIAWIVFNSLKSLLYRGQTSLLTLERTRLYFTSNPEEETRGTSAGGETSREAAHNTIELITCTVECTYIFMSTFNVHVPWAPYICMGFTMFTSIHVSDVIVITSSVSTHAQSP